MPVALFAALEAEARAMARRLAPSIKPSPHVSIWEGEIEGTPAVLAVTGVGKVAAALAAQFVCDAFHPRCALTFGLAGATHSDAQPGHLIVDSGALQHDVDGRPLTDAKGVIPSLGMTVFAADPTWAAKLRHAAEHVANPKLVSSGVVLTGDQIVTSREIRDGLMRDFPQGACFDMETAAIAQVAHQNGIPWGALRMTSDAADESFDLGDVLGFRIDTAAELFDRVIGALLNET
jgi:adenosylhomocysteine nucleosidase